MMDGGRDVPFPVRPSLTLPFICAMLFWTACAISYSTGDVREPQTSATLAVFSLTGTIAAFALAGFRRARMPAVLLASFLVGLMLGNAQAASIHTVAGTFEDTADLPAEIELLEDSRDHGFGESALVRAWVGEHASATFSARFGKRDPLYTGDRLECRVTFSSVDYGENAYAWSEASCGQLKVAGETPVPSPFPLEVLFWIRKRAIEGIGGESEASALLQALVCGYRRNISGTAMYAEFQGCGLAHLVAVSGAHLVIVTGLAASLLERARAPRKLTIGVLVAVMGAYFIVAGMPVSALRAMAMSALGLFSYFGRRRASSLNAVGIATFAIIALSPCACVSVSFALSALSTIGIVLFAPLFQAWLGRTPVGALSFVSDALSLTLSASLLSQLYACSLFNQLPVVAPLANIVTAPLFPLACGAGLVLGIASAFTSTAATPLGMSAQALASALAASAGLISSLPYASIPFAIDSKVALALSASCALVLWAAWPRPNWKAVGACALGALALAISLQALGGREDAIVALDVGQGDAILVESRGRRYLVDTGNQDSKLLEQLAVNHVTHLDGVVITHADDDHCGSVPALDRAVEVDRFIVAHDMVGCGGENARDLVETLGRSSAEIVGVEAGDSFPIGAFSTHVIWPRSFVEDGGNADSLCLLLDYDGDDDGVVDFKALLTGDAEKEELASMLDNGDVGDIDILKVGHHGSRNGMTASQVSILSPEVALISCGENNRYGHPTREILDMLDDAGARVFRTDEDGEIRCTLAPDSLEVTTFE